MKDVAYRSQTFGQFASAEGGSGAAYSDENGSYYFSNGKTI